MNEDINLEAYVDPQLMIKDGPLWTMFMGGHITHQLFSFMIIHGSYHCASD
jgi:hypothetical protein